MITKKIIDKIIKNNPDVRSVVSVNRKQYRVVLNNGEAKLMTARELSHYAAPVQVNVKKHVKWEDNNKNRASTRDAIKTEDFEKIPQNQKTKRGNIANWD